MENSKVPRKLERFVHLLLSYFYSTEDFLIVDLLMKKICLTEKDLEKDLMLGHDVLRSSLQHLMADKVIHYRYIIEDDDGDSRRKVTPCYYYIDYRKLVNAVKYRLFVLKRNLRNSQGLIRFRCRSCQTDYGDESAANLIDPETMNYVCIFCAGKVEDEGPPKPVVRGLVNKFHTKMVPLESLLKVVDRMPLEEISDIPGGKLDRNSAAVPEMSGDATRTRREEGFAPEEVKQKKDSKATEAPLDVVGENVWDMSKPEVVERVAVERFQHLMNIVQRYCSQDRPEKAELVLDVEPLTEAQLQEWARRTNSLLVNKQAIAFRKRRNDNLCFCKFDDAL